MIDVAIVEATTGTKTGTANFSGSVNRNVLLLVELDEALARAEAYRRAGADAILIHSKAREPGEVLAFFDFFAGVLGIFLERVARSSSIDSVRFSAFASWGVASSSSVRGRLRAASK